LQAVFKWLKDFQALLTGTGTNRAAATQTMTTMAIAVAIMDIVIAVVRQNVAVTQASMDALVVKSSLAVR